MEKQAPTVGKLAVIIGFALSCLAILIYLWVLFGGATPLRPKGYEVKVPFDEATQLAVGAELRITGVKAGNVRNVDLTPDGRHAEATIEIDPEFSPIPADTKAILRTKTLLGETYVEFTPGTDSAPKLPEDGTLPLAQVAPTVELDEILRSFDEPTRLGFQSWMQNAAVATHGRGVDLSNAIAQLQPTFAGFDQLFRTLDTETEAVRQLFANGATTIDALRGRQHDLRRLVIGGERTFSAIGRRNSNLEQAFRAFPTFLDQSRITFDRLERFALATDPLIRQLTPAAKQLSPTFVQLARGAPGFRSFFSGLRPTANRSPAGLGAFRSLIQQDFPPLLVALDPFLRSLNPILQDLGNYSPEITALFANPTAALNGTLPGSSGSKPHYIRSLAVMTPDSVAAYPKRLAINRNNAYTAPGGSGSLFGLAGFETRQCGSGVHAELDPNSPSNADFNARTNNDVAKAQVFFDSLKLYAFGDKLNSNATPAPACGKQPAQPTIGASGPATDYRHVVKQAP